VRPAAVFPTLLLIAAAPVTVLAVLAGSGLANVGAAIGGIGAVLLIGLGIAVLWARDIEVLAETARGAAADPPVPPTDQPLLPGIARVAREIERLARTATQRVALADRRRRADEAIIERLPDPLIVLGADHAVRRTNATARGAFGDDCRYTATRPRRGQV